MIVHGATPEDRLRIAVLGDFDSVHTRSWLHWFVERGHDVHAISFYPPQDELGGVTVHSLRSRAPNQRASGVNDGGARRLPLGVMRLVHALRYQGAGLARTIRAISPDVLHAHYVVEHGFYGAIANWHPYVVTAWGSDVLRDPERDRLSRWIARWTMRRADVITSNNAYMAERMVALGASPARVHLITLGADGTFLEAGRRSPNLEPGNDDRRPRIVSTRAHEPLYNIPGIIEAYRLVTASHGNARLTIAHGGSLTAKLQRSASELVDAGRIDFTGSLDRDRFRALVADAEIFVSVPSSDGTSVALLQAMAAGCFPIVSDLATQHAWIEHGVNGFLVPVGDPHTLADHLRRALDDAPLRRAAAAHNARLVEERGLNEHEMAKMERLYIQLARGRQGRRGAAALA